MLRYVANRLRTMANGNNFIFSPFERKFARRHGKTMCAWLDGGGGETDIQWWHRRSRHRRSFARRKCENARKCRKNYSDLLHASDAKTRFSVGFSSFFFWYIPGFRTARCYACLFCERCVCTHARTGFDRFVFPQGSLQRWRTRETNTESVAVDFSNIIIFTPRRRNPVRSERSQRKIIVQRDRGKFYLRNWPSQNLLLFNRRPRCRQSYGYH